MALVELSSLVQMKKIMVNNPKNIMAAEEVTTILEITVLFAAVRTKILRGTQVDRGAEMSDGIAVARADLGVVIH